MKDAAAPWCPPNAGVILGFGTARAIPVAVGAEVLLRKCP